MIKSEVLTDGKSQIIGFIGIDNEGRQIGIFNGGAKYVSDVLTCDERITVISGNIWVNNVKMTEGTKRRFPKGTVLTIEAHKTACFIRKTIGYRT